MSSDRRERVAKAIEFWWAHRDGLPQAAIDEMWQRHVLDLRNDPDDPHPDHRWNQIIGKADAALAVIDAEPKDAVNPLARIAALEEAVNELRREIECHHHGKPWEAA